MNVKSVALSLAIMTLGACASAPTIFDADPRQWGDEHQTRIQSLPLLGYSGVCDLARRQANAAGKSPAEKMLLAELRRRGLTGRDIELIGDPKHIYGTGMSFHGLSCALARVPPTNRAFYPGIGHQWQAITGEGYVYLVGDGTPEGMRVRSWN